MADPLKIDGPVEIHASPCAHCPSAWLARDSREDEESKDIKKSCSRAERVASAFPCAWRPGKLCKGYCDYLDVTEADLAVPR